MPYELNIKCMHEDDSPRNARGQCLWCMRARERVRYAKEKAREIERAKNASEAYIKSLPIRAQQRLLKLKGANQ